MVLYDQFVSVADTRSRYNSLNLVDSLEAILASIILHIDQKMSHIFHCSITFKGFSIHNRISTTRNS